ncbi:MAG: SGNH/GDSL hydrolase family protein [Phycisphaerae bacterium]|nr:SGNH/GDSL hydrolase family protein [Phycisphaerae bacterium]
MNGPPASGAPRPADAPRIGADSASHPPRPPRTPRRLRRWLIALGSLALLGLIAAELTLRLALGLGDPPLYRTHPTIEYLMQPGVYRRFGHTVSINRWHMRSPDLPQAKPPGEFRILVIGDSVVNGGSPTDDADLATALLGPALERAWSRPRITVCNISAGSWGPDNQLAYLREFGAFDADLAILVLNSYDWGDVPTFAPLTWEMPTRRPLLALQEVIENYGPRLLGRSSAPTTHDEANPPEAMTRQSEAALRDMVALLRARGVRIAAVQHATQSELTGAFHAGHAKLQALLESLGVPVEQSGRDFAGALAAGRRVYRDEIHPSADGQRALLNVLQRAADRAMAAPVPAGSGGPPPTGR